MLEDINPALLLDHIGTAQATPLAIKDLNHRFIYVNDPFCKATGISRDSLIGKNDIELGRPKELVLGDPASGWPGLWTLDDQAVSQKALSRTTDTIPGRHANTETVRIPILNDSGDAVALMVQLFDISEVRDLKQRVASNVDALSLREGEISTMELVLASLMACQDTNTLLEQLAKTLVDRTRADCCYAATLHESGEFMEIVAASGNHSSQYLGGQFRRNEGTIGRAWSRGEAIYLTDVSTIQSIHQWPAGTQAFSLPLFVDNEAVAALTVISARESEDLAADVPLLHRICGMASMAIANTRLIDMTQQRLKGTRALAEVSQLLTVLDDITEACDTVCHILLPAMDATFARIFLLDDHGQLHSQVGWGFAQGASYRADPLHPDHVRQRIAQWCVENDQIATIGRLDEDTRESAEIYAMRAARNIGSTCCIPLKKQGRVFGAMLLYRTREMREFSEAHIDIFQAVVNQLSTSIDRIELSRELKHQAFHDRLTGMANRHQFERILDKAIVDAKHSHSTFCVLFIDLDGFKEVNDTLGHAIGDKLLAMVAARLAARLDRHSSLARMGGDEFAVILQDDAGGITTANSLLQALNAKFVIDGEMLSIGASIGIGRFPDNGDTAAHLLQSADEAMYQAKRVGKGCVCLFDESVAIAARQRNLLETQLREAINQRQFHLFYQPQVRCQDSQVVGMEALIRWIHPARGLVPPGEFIPVAERTGLINPIGSWVIDESIRQLAQWQNTPAANLRVSINIAAPQFQQDDFCDQIIHALKRHGAPANLLELEVTESVLMDDVKIVAARLQRLRDVGVRIAIDDFGTGYSSLSYLQDLPLDVLKIDRTFVNRLDAQSSKASLISTIQTLASSLGLETVAEGVELPEQLDQISRLGCDMIQGYLYSRPVPADELPATIRSINELMEQQPQLRNAS
jgi:diguanylate cyclase (GGDEF)-like protein